MCMEVHVLVCEGQRVVPGVSLIFVTQGPALYETLTSSERLACWPSSSLATPTLGLQTRTAIPDY